jgi:head-tail adaptor
MATRGQKRHLVTLENPLAAAPDGDGGYIQIWAPLTPPRMRAEIKPATARELERLAAGTVLSSASHIVTMDYHAQVTTETRIVFRTRYFSVTGVSNPEERNIETICVCVELMGVPAAADVDSWVQGGWSQ